MRIYGVDFTCAPRRAKPIAAAVGLLNGARLRIERVEQLGSFAEFEALLARPGPWVGGFDFPFSLPRELVRDLGWPPRWKALVEHCAKLRRGELVVTPTDTVYVRCWTRIAPQGRSAPNTRTAPPTIPRAPRAR